ncbi:methionyl-tRNA formyltransferase [Muriicola sp. Z0-33]|uniref:methionyl-tRNA formyltransferase n=1 Tax=Muriicola sp. Z0-33 TaxID=2816957 RepID=UPI0022382706|nr:methionyl-tRNA formyltransferase [Muriicola sp. Z0-33]MCW5515539.1 methionyl-tRNA formyltransferase [Muriicola sp. Z0-33]
MRDLRIVFMGTPDFAVATLATLIANSYNVVGVVTAADKPAGRGRKLRESAVKVFAREKNLRLMQPTNLKDDAFIEELKSLKSNLQIVVAFRMLPKVVWQMPKYGTFNLHASLLPDYRGAAPINWAIINGETETGVTTFFIDEKIDTGAIILQARLSIEAEDTAGSLHDKLMLKGADLVLKTVGLIQEDKAQPQIQEIPEGTELKSANKIHKDTCRIDWKQPMNQIQNLIRGLSPYPTAWTTILDNEEVILLKIFTSNTQQEEHGLNNGTIVCNKKELKVAVSEGYINLVEIQLAGKRRMSIKDALNGLNLSKKAYMV